VELQRSLSEMLRNPAYVPSTSYSSARADVKAKAEMVLAQMARIRTHSKIVGEPHFAAPIAEFAAMLKQFAE